MWSQLASLASQVSETVAPVAQEFREALREDQDGDGSVKEKIQDVARPSAAVQGSSSTTGRSGWLASVVSGVAELREALQESDTENDLERTAATGDGEEEIEASEIAEDENMIEERDANDNDDIRIEEDVVPREQAEDEFESRFEVGPSTPEKVVSNDGPSVPGSNILSNRALLTPMKDIWGVVSSVKGAINEFQEALREESDNEDAETHKAHMLGGEDVVAEISEEQEVAYENELEATANQQHVSNVLSTEEIPDEGVYSPSEVNGTEDAGRDPHLPAEEFDAPPVISKFSRSDLKRESALSGRQFPSDQECEAEVEARRGHFVFIRKVDDSGVEDIRMHASITLLSPSEDDPTTLEVQQVASTIHSRDGVIEDEETSSSVATIPVSDLSSSSSSHLPPRSSATIEDITEAMANEGDSAHHHQTAPIAVESAEKRVRGGGRRGAKGNRQPRGKAETTETGRPIDEVVRTPEATSAPVIDELSAASVQAAAPEAPTQSEPSATSDATLKTSSFEPTVTPLKTTASSEVEITPEAGDSAARGSSGPRRNNRGRGGQRQPTTTKAASTGVLSPGDTLVAPVADSSPKASEDTAASTEPSSVASVVFRQRNDGRRGRGGNRGGAAVKPSLENDVVPVVPAVQPVELETAAESDAPSAVQPVELETAAENDAPPAVQRVSESGTYHGVVEGAAATRERELASNEGAVVAEATAQSSSETEPVQLPVEEPASSAAAMASNEAEIKVAEGEMASTKNAEEERPSGGGRRGSRGKKSSPRSGRGGTKSATTPAASVDAPNASVRTGQVVDGGGEVVSHPAPIETPSSSRVGPESDGQEAPDVTIGTTTIESVDEVSRPKEDVVRMTLETGEGVSGLNEVTATMNTSEDSEVSRLKEELAGLQATMTSIASNKETGEDGARLREELATLRTQLHQSNSLRQSMESDMHRLVEDHSRLQRDLADRLAHEEKLRKDFEHSLADLSRDNDRLKQTLQSSSSSLQEHEAHFRSAIDAEREARARTETQARQAVQEIQTKLAEERTRAKALESELSRSRQDAKTESDKLRQAWEAERSDLQSSLSQTARAVEKLKETNRAVVEKAFETEQALQEELEAGRRRVADLEADISKVQGSMDQYIQDLRAEANAKETELVKAREEISKLLSIQTDLHVALEENAELRKQVETLADRKDLERALEEVALVQGEASRAASVYSQKVQALEAELAATRSDAQMLRTDNGTLMTELDKVKKALMRTTQELEKAESVHRQKVVQLRADIVRTKDEYEQQLSASNERHDEVKQDLMRTKEELVQVQQALAAREAHIAAAAAAATSSSSSSSIGVSNASSSMDLQIVNQLVLAFVKRGRESGDHGRKEVVETMARMLGWTEAQKIDVLSSFNQPSSASSTITAAVAATGVVSRGLDLLLSSTSTSNGGVNKSTGNESANAGSGSTSSSVAAVSHARRRAAPALTTDAAARLLEKESFEDIFFKEFLSKEASPVEATKRRAAPSKPIEPPQPATPLSSRALREQQSPSAAATGISAVPFAMETEETSKASTAEASSSGQMATEDGLPPNAPESGSGVTSV